MGLGVPAGFLVAVAVGDDVGMDVMVGADVGMDVTVGDDVGMDVTVGADVEMEVMVGVAAMGGVDACPGLQLDNHRPNIKVQMARNFCFVFILLPRRDKRRQDAIFVWTRYAGRWNRPSHSD